MASKKKSTTNASKKKAKTTKSKNKELFGLTAVPDELADRGREIWLAGLGALSMVEKEGAKLFNSLVDKGKGWETEGRKQLGAARKKLDETRERVESVVSDVAAKGSQVTELDDVILSRIEETVEKTLQRLGVPTHAEVKDLASKVEKLAVEVTTLAVVIEKKSTISRAAGSVEGGDASSKKTVYHIVPHDRGWAVKQEGVTKPLSRHTTKQEAHHAGRAIAKDQAPSRLVTHKKDGQVQKSVSFAA